MRKATHFSPETGQNLVGSRHHDGLLYYGGRSQHITSTLALRRRVFKERCDVRVRANISRLVWCRNIWRLLVEGLIRDHPRTWWGFSHKRWPCLLLETFNNIVKTIDQRNFLNLSQHAKMVITLQTTETWYFPEDREGFLHAEHPHPKICNASDCRIQAKFTGLRPKNIEVPIIDPVVELAVLHRIRPCWPRLNSWEIRIQRPWARVKGRIPCVQKWLLWWKLARRLFRTGRESTFQWLQQLGRRRLGSGSWYQDCWSRRSLVE